MPNLSLTASTKAVKTYYADIADKRQLHLIHEGNVAPAFADLLNHAARKVGYQLSEQHPLPVPKTKRKIYPDGAILTVNNLLFGLWEAKDSADDLDKEIAAKFQRGYPSDNILFNLSPSRLI